LGGSQKTLELTLFLLQGLNWSDGAPFTTADITFWWNDNRMNKEIRPTATPNGS
jgi:peptide/nickel transport system substrate-binding protein